MLVSLSLKLFIWSHLQSIIISMCLILFKNSLTCTKSPPVQVVTLCNSCVQDEILSVTPSNNVDTSSVTDVQDVTHFSLYYIYFYYIVIFIEYIILFLKYIRTLPHILNILYNGYSTSFQLLQNLLHILYTSVTLHNLFIFKVIIHQCNNN